jgi:DNA repair exonuclease SbcCD ATPase subunit
LAALVKQHEQTIAQLEIARMQARERTSAWARDEAQEVRAELDGMQQQAMLMQIQQQQQQQAAMMQQQQKQQQQQQQAMIQQGYAAFNAQWMIDQYVRERAMNAAELEVALSNLFNVELKSGTASRQRLESILLVTTGSGEGLGADDLEDCVALFHLVSIGVCDAKEQADVLGTHSKEYSL